MRRLIVLLLLILVALPLAAQDLPPQGSGGSSVDSDALDTAFGSTRGAVLYRGAAGWTELVPDTSGHVLTDGGVGADPAWALPAITSATLDTAFGSTQGTILHRASGGWAALAVGASGDVLTTNGAGNDVSWTTVSGGISNVVEDTTPQFGGDFASNGFDLDMGVGDRVMIDDGDATAPGLAFATATQTGLTTLFGFYATVDKGTNITLHMEDGGGLGDHWVRSGQNTWALSSSTGLRLGSGLDVLWSSTAAPGGSADTGWRRGAAGRIEASDGSTGDGTLRVGAGDLTTPGISIGADDNAGIYEINDDLKFVADNALRLTLGSTSAAFVPLVSSTSGFETSGYEVRIDRGVEFPSAGAGVYLANDAQIAWGDDGTVSQADLDAGLDRVSAGVVKVTDGSTGYGALDIPRGAFYWSTPSATAITDTTPVLAAGTTTAGSLADFTHNGSGRLTYTGAGTADFVVTLAISATKAAGSSAEFDFMLYENGSAITGAFVSRTIGSTAEGALAVTWIVTAATNDYYELYIRNNTNGDDLTVQAGSMVIR